VSPAIAVVMVTYQSATDAPRTLAAVAEQLAADDELVVVDNDSGDGTVEAVRAAVSGARVLEQDGNLGFAAGCHAGAAASTAPLLLFLNPDATPAPGCIEALRSAAGDRPGWGAWQALVTMAGGHAINTSGNRTHYLGFGWAGRCGDPVSSAPAEPEEVGFGSGAALLVRREDWERAGGFDERYFMYCEDLDLSLRLRLAGRGVGIAPAEPEEVGFGSGAALVVRREDWERAGGFDERYFMYCEDLDLSLRLRLAGRGVGIAPAARVEHDYEFAKGGQKWYLLERNRAWTVLSDYPGRLLALLAPALLAFELALLPVAWRGGWLREKLGAQATVLRELPAILARRREVQRTRAIGAREFAAQLTADLDSPYLEGAARVGPLVALQRGYWKLVLALL
jgi:N-acetylglucosaminyl-diphospho-decaprenol L-rhamnosyltransferase